MTGSDAPHPSIIRPDDPRRTSGKLQVGIMGQRIPTGRRGCASPDAFAAEARIDGAEGVIAALSDADVVHFPTDPGAPVSKGRMVSGNTLAGEESSRPRAIP
ncbi:hypothetical protein [Methylobacterium planeticum]|uniref:Uncharacterized protein n=1 Tax=Methylobacterium planeticum TaxID=2615211 RepID=A0A6N6MR76_9HYPH|nr:hypothetical protein [Methylobacterium planeticum]KAB1073976.1 hypothetical protein F6X51_09645 [Methylobacterium planeticum]